MGSTDQQCNDNQSRATICGEKVRLAKIKRMAVTVRRHLHPGYLWVDEHVTSYSAVSESSDP